MTLYMGVDFHPHQQTVAWCDTRTVDLKHELEKVREFYQTLPEPAIIGIEASARPFGSRTCVLLCGLCVKSMGPLLKPNINAEFVERDDDVEARKIDLNLVKIS